MGIPFYFRDLVRNHPDVVLDALPRGRRCARLHFDANSVIHQSAQQVLAEQAQQHAQPRSQEELEARIHARIQENIEHVVRAAAPTELVFVAVDGLCPAAKLHQQRKRRYMSAWRNRQLGIDAAAWDSNCITPGTAFMERLDAALGAWARGRGYLFSGSCEPGEGEHKIFQLIRERTRAESTAATVDGAITGTGEAAVDVVYGLDADLIMLSLISPNRRNIFLLRERPHFLDGKAGKGKHGGKHGQGQGQGQGQGPEFLHLHVGALEDSIRAEHGLADVAEYVALCVLMGNDFLPPLSYLKIVDDGIQRLIKTYNALAKAGPICDAASATLDTVVLQQLVQALARDEDACMAQACEAYHARTCPPASRRTDLKTAADRAAYELDHYPTLHKFSRALINPSAPGWRMAYYHHLFPAPGGGRADPGEVCAAYVRGLAWVVQYYFDYEAAPRSWHYPHLYAPTALDLHNHLLTAACLPAGDAGAAAAEEEEARVYGELVANPELQLLAVLPPCSAARLLRTDGARALVADVRLGCAHMFPRGFRIATFLKHFLWECAPLLPEVDVPHLAARLRRPSA